MKEQEINKLVEELETLKELPRTDYIQEKINNTEIQLEDLGYYGRERDCYSY